MTELLSYLNKNLKDHIAAFAKYFREEWGIDKRFDDDCARLYISLYLYGLSPRITSGRRSKKKQDELIQRYNMGDPSVIVKPAEKSKHLDGLAIDIVTSNAALAAFVAKNLNIGTGYSFKNPDPVHFYKLERL